MEGKENELLNQLKGKRVKVLFCDEGKTKVIKGVLREVGETYIVVDSVIIGLGNNFISCIPQNDQEGF